MLLSKQISGDNQKQKLSVRIISPPTFRNHVRKRTIYYLFFKYIMS